MDEPAGTSRGCRSCSRNRWAWSVPRVADLVSSRTHISIGEKAWRLQQPESYRTAQQQGSLRIRCGSRAHDDRAQAGVWMATDTHEREIRIGRNQALFREVNERVETLRNSSY